MVASISDTLGFFVVGVETSVYNPADGRNRGTSPRYVEDVEKTASSVTFLGH